MRLANFQLIFPREALEKLCKFLPSFLICILLQFYLQKTKSSKQQVVLTNLSLSSGGTYKCEVSAEAPSFRTKFAKQDMVVVVLPTKAEIVGVQPKYQVGDIVNVTCFSYR